MSKIVKNHREKECINRLTSKIKLANRLILEDIHRKANPQTPLSRGLPTDGDLREQVEKRIDNKSGIIRWKVPYASYQERGARYDGSHRVTHYTTPGTGRQFAKKAVKEVVTSKTLKRYFF